MHHDRSAIERNSLPGVAAGGYRPARPADRRATPADAPVGRGLRWGREAGLPSERPGLLGRRMIPRASPPDRRQRDLFDAGRRPTATCPVCRGKKTVAFWSRQGKAPVIGGKQVLCKACHGTGRVAARA
jgi:hypothetical protein